MSNDLVIELDEEFGTITLTIPPARVEEEPEVGETEDLYDTLESVSNILKNEMMCASEEELMSDLTCDYPRFKLMSSCGELTVSAVTGVILSKDLYYTSDGENYLEELMMADIIEWQREYPNESLAGSIHDILDFGFWSNDTTYDGPSEDWRSDRRDRLRDEQ